MKHPTINRSDLQELAETKLTTGACDLDGRIVWSGGDDPIDLDHLLALATELNEAREAFEAGPDKSDRDLFEGRVAGRIHPALAGLPIQVLDDAGFWRYLTLAHFWDLVVWRESKAFESSDYARYRSYIDGTQPSECVLMRMFLRGQVALEHGSYELVDAIPKGTDFWRSHILRVRTSSAPIVSRAFVREQAADRMGTLELRAFARRLNRVRTNVVLDVYESDEAEELMVELREA